MKQSTKRLTSSVVAIILLILAFVLLFNFIQPAYADLSRIRGDIISATDFADNQDRVIGEVQRLVEAYESSQDTQAALSLALPWEPRVGEVIGQLNGLLQINGLIAQSFSVLPEQTRPVTRAATEKNEQQQFTINPPQTVSVRFKAIGAYADFKKFLANAETNIRLMSIKEVKVQNDAQKPEQGLLSYEGLVEAYYQGKTN